MVALLLLRSRKRFWEFKISSRFLSIKLFAFSDNAGDGEYFDIIAELSNWFVDVLGRVPCSWLVWAIIASFVLLVLLFVLNKIFLKKVKIN